MRVLGVAALLIGSVMIPAALQAQPAALLLPWGSFSSGPGGFVEPRGVAVDGSGNVLVVDRQNHRVEVFTSNGTFVRQLGGSATGYSPGSGPGQFNYPEGVAVAPNGDVYVADTFNYRVQVFHADGSYVSQWPTTAGHPLGIAFTAGGDVFVTFGHSVVQRYSTVGTLLQEWGANTSISAYGIAVDAAGEVLIADSQNSQVKVYIPGGTLLRSWGALGYGRSQLRGPWGIALDGAGNIYVGDIDGFRVQVFTNSGTYIGEMGLPGSGPGQFGQPYGVAVDAGGSIYVADGVNNRIDKFAPGITPTRPRSWSRIKRMYR